MAEEKDAKVVIAPAPVVPAKLAVSSEKKVETVEKEDPTKFKEDSWMFHKTHEPKLFKKGETIPEEWESVNRWGWKRDHRNNFHWMK